MSKKNKSNSNALKTLKAKREKRMFGGFVPMPALPFNRQPPKKEEEKTPVVAPTDPRDASNAATAANIASGTLGGTSIAAPDASGAPTAIIQEKPVAATVQDATKGVVGANVASGITQRRDIQQLDDNYTKATTSGVKAPAAIKTTESVAATGKVAPVADAATYTATEAEDLDETEAAQGQVSPEAIATAEDATMTAPAEAAERDAAAEVAALSETVGFDVSQKAYVDKVTGKEVQVASTPEAEAAQRTAITDGTLTTGQAAKIIGTVGFEASQRRTVTGEAAKGAAASMIAEVGGLPPEISASIVEDPATVLAALDNEPVEVRAAIAALPTEALVSSQMESLLGGMEDGKTPAWAKPAVAQVEAVMAQRGLSTSTVGRDALFNAIIQSALPMAQSNAQALQQRSAQNLSNEQQANMSTATLDAQRRMANLSNQQTANSQTAQMAQQMSTMQSQFRQDAVMTTAQIQQQARQQDLANLQQAAMQNVQNQQATNAQNLGNEQQIELANMQYMNATESENMSATQQQRMVEMQTAADFLAKNQGFAQQMSLANMSNEQQTRLANLSALNQASSENMSAEQQTELANLNSRMQTNLTQAKIAESMGLAQLNVDQQRASTERFYGC